MTDFPKDQEAGKDPCHQLVRGLAALPWEREHTAVSRYMHVLALLTTLAVWRPGPAGEGSTAVRVVLDNRTPLRFHFTWRTVLVRRKSGQVEFCRVTWRSRGKAKLTAVAEPTGTQPPPGEWTSVDFDDSSWPRARPPMFTRGTREVALICARGKFHVPDPRAAELTLRLSYRGGAVVYVNGAEVFRGHLPAGKLRPLTPAQDYPDEAYLRPDGYLLRWVGFGDPEKYRDRFALRQRRLEVKVPASALRRGTNVLAVELHRAPISELFYTSKFKEAGRYFMWDTVALEVLELTGRGAVPNVARPGGWQIWNHPTYLSVHNADYGDPNEPLRPICIAGTRNGSFSGKVVVGSDRPVVGLRAEAAALTGPDGAVIPATALEVRYGLRTDHAASRNESDRGRPAPAYARGLRRFDGLAEKPPQQVPTDPKVGGAVVPVWLTVHIPRDAKPGKYTGRLTIAARGLTPVEVPVILTVAAWALPDPKEFVSFMGLVQSPDTLAIRYGLPMWSEEHWKLIDRSFELMGRLGVKTIYIPVLARTYFGNEHSMVRWVSRPAATGSAPASGPWQLDFSIVERYIATAIRHLDKVPVVCLYCWDVGTGSKYFGMDKYKYADNTGVPFTVIDAGTRRPAAAAGPKWGTPESRAFWKPVLAGLRRVLQRHGLAGAMMVGISGDRRPNKDAVEDLRAAAPEAPWVSSSHTVPRNLHGQPVGYASAVWGVGAAPDPAEKRYHGWKCPRLVVVFPRYGCGAIGYGIRTNFALGCYRIGMEAALVSPGPGRRGLRGIGRCGADFWPVLKSKGGRRLTVLGRYPENKAWHGGYLRNSTPYLLAPGSDGPVATVRFEALREGIQEAEARIFIEKALLDPAKRARLGEKLAGRCQRLLDERVRIIRRAIAGGGRYLTWTYLAGAGLERQAERLYQAAAEVARALKANQQ
ncbi:MAG: hypothetical protein B1H04_01855 [Planctomycetales bacterium 4484_123]|nr:MAG: hypothetical protein B1H04_01855 [Planctomycetales bacterium 4484_123]